MNKIKLMTFIAGGIGLLDALYLSWSKLFHQQVICGTYKGCETVNSSPYAEIGGIPIALLGAGAYIVILGMLYMEDRSPFWRDNGPLGIFVVSLAGTLYSAYLTYIEVRCNPRDLPVLRRLCDRHDSGFRFNINAPDKSTGGN